MTISKYHAAGTTVVAAGKLNKCARPTGVSRVNVKRTVFNAVRVFVGEKNPTGRAY